jgi:hypothetical protein
MSTNDPTTTRKPGKQRWTVPLLSLTIGVAYFVAGWLGGNRTFAVFGLVLMTATAVAFVLLSRFSETVAGLMDRRDERINRIDSEATTIAGLAVIVAVIVGFVVEIAHGRNGSPYSMLGAIGGVAYIAALIFLRFRR